MICVFVLVFFDRGAEMVVVLRDSRGVPIGDLVFQNFEDPKRAHYLKFSALRC